MSAKKTVIVALTWTCSLLLSCPGAWAWQRNINGTLKDGSDWASAVAVDGSGHVVAAGVTNNTGTYTDFTVAKFDGVSGQELWRRVINGNVNGEDWAYTVAVDGLGNVLAAGITNGIWDLYDAFLYASNFTVIKFDGASGAELWRKHIQGTANRSDSAYAVAVDIAGNVVAVGSTQNTDTSSDITVVKLDGVTGAELWRKDISGTADSYDSARALAMDGAGNVLVAGSANARCVTFDGCSVGDYVSDFTVIKFDGATGTELWRKDINGTPGSYNYAYLLAVDGAGNVVAAGVTNTGYTSRDLTVVKMDGANGIELWRQEISGTANGWDSLNAMALDVAGNVVAAGSTENTGSHHDFTVVKFKGATGAELWRKDINGTANGDDSANAVTVDAAGNVVVAGGIYNAGSVNDFTVIKFDGASGEELWRQLVIASDPNFGGWASAVAVDGIGNVVAAGSIGSDFTVVKLPEMPAQLFGIAADLASPQNLGATITFTATANGGFAPLQYKWWVYNGVAWSVVSDWSTSNSFAWSAGLAGNYRIGVWVKSSGNPADAPENNAFAGINFTITAPSALMITAVSADQVSSQPAGSTITFTATTSGGLAPLQYKWWVFNGVVWSVLNDWSTSSSFTWTPGLAGNYLVGVWVKSNGNSADAPEGNAYDSIPFTISPPPTLALTGISSDQTSPQPAGSTITFTASTSGGLGPLQYKWWVFNGGVWSIVKDWSASDSFNWTAGLGGSYRVGVWVKSNLNPADAPEGSAYNSVEFAINAPPNLILAGISADQISPQPVGSTITFTAATSGGLAAHQYKWWVFNGVAWSMVKDWSAGNSFSWMPGMGGNYLVGVWVKSDLNPVDAPEGNAYNSVAFTINAPAIPVRSVESVLSDSES